MVKFIVQSKFKNQLKRIDVLENLLNKQNYKKIITNNSLKNDDKSYQGFIYETISIILILLKCLPIKFKNILVGKFEEYNSQTQLIDIRQLLNISINQGNDKADITLLDNSFKKVFSIKYRDNETADIDKLGVSILKLNCRENDLIGLIVKDKNKIINHHFKTKSSKSMEVLNEIIDNKLLFDENDIIAGYEEFKNKFKKKICISDFIDLINKDYLNNNRQILIQKLHQSMFRQKIIKSIKQNNLIHLIQNKPRSGKSILILLICLDLFSILKKKKILILTSVPSTIESFIKDLNKYDIFKKIKYFKQNEFMNLQDDFKGICFTSVQYLKNDIGQQNKKEKFKSLNFDACIFDESDFGSSTEKTLTDILSISKNIRSQIKIFASGTASKTKSFYKIPNKFIYTWDIEDENFMKSITNKENYELMIKRHGNEFKECFNNNYINKDYSNCPSQILIQPKIISSMLTKIESYNLKHNTNFGYSISSLLSLKPRKPTKKDSRKFIEEFEICSTDEGQEFLSSVFEKIFSNDLNDENTIERYIENTQSKYESRKTSKDSPKLFIVYLPTNNNKGNICSLQKTLVKFLNKNKLWCKYKLCYSNSEYSSGDSKEEFNEFVKKELILTKKENKKGCILFLGRQGGRGVTYHECDVTISFDDGHNLDEHKQRFYRSLTPAIGKTIGINVDLNIQRTYYLLKNIINNFQKFHKSKSFSEILYYLTQQKIFIFNPQDVNYTDIIDIEIKKYYNSVVDKVRLEIKENIILDNIDCEDIMLENLDISLNFNDLINKDLEGRQKDCLKPGEKKVLTHKGAGDAGDASDAGDAGDASDASDADDDLNYKIINKTKEFLKKILPLLCCIMKSTDNYNIEERLFKNDKYSKLINSNITKFLNKNLLNKIDINKIKNTIIIIMTSLEERNSIISDLIEIYRNSSPNEYRALIAKHFIPTEFERQNNAEIPTPVKTVDNMLNTLDNFDISFWTKNIKVLEPCCGKGNFILAIFNKFYESLKDKYINKSELCKKIIQDNIYLCDIEENNIFICEELLKIHAESYCQCKLENLMFNSYVGDTLKLNINEVWSINKFDIIIGNPPYQEKNKNGKSKHGKNNLWSKFISYSFENLKKDGLLLFVTPTSWMNGTVNCFDKMIENQIHHLNVNECKKDFIGVGSQFSYYLIENKEIYKETDVVCEYQNIIYKNKIMINKNMKILPLLLTPEVIDLTNKLFNFNINNKFIRKDQIKVMSKETKTNLDSEFFNPIITYKKKTGELDIRYCNKKLNNQDFKKVLLFRNGYLNPVYDNGKNGVGNNIHFCVVNNEEEGLNLVELYESNIYKFMFAICKYSGFNNGRVMNWLYKQNTLAEIKKNLTDEEIKTVADFIN